MDGTLVGFSVVCQCECLRIGPAVSTIMRRFMQKATGSRVLALLLITLASAFRSQAQAPITYQYTYDSLGKLTRVVDSTGVSVRYTYDLNGNITAVTRTTVTSGLTILSFSPTQAGPGGTVT